MPPSPPSEELRRSPHLAGLHRNLGLAAVLQEDWPRAAAEFVNELRRNPADGPSAYHLTLCLRHLGRLDEARLAARLALRLTPTSQRVRDLANELQATL